MKEIKRIFWKYKIQIVLVLIIILIISRLTYHSDVINVAKPTEIIVNGNFSLVQKSKTGEIVYSSFFPPIFHFIDSLIYWPLSKLGVYNFDLNNISIDKLPLVGFLLKLRYLFLYILSIFLIIGISNNFEVDKKNRNKIFLLWLLCPVLIFMPFSWGNNDIYPVFLLLLFLFFAFKKKYFLTMMFLGLSAATKNFSLFLILPATLIIANKNIKKTIFYCLVSFLVYSIPLLIYFKTSYTFFTGGGEGLFILNREVLGGTLFFPLIYFLVLLFLITKQKINDFNKNEILVKYCIFIISLFYLTSLYIPHWFLWIIPFFVLTAYKNKKMFYLYVLINITLFIGMFSWSRNIDMSLFAMSFPVINRVMSLNEFIIKYFSSFKIFEIVNSMFVASFGCYLYLLFFDKDMNLPKEELSEKEINLFSMFPLSLYLAICFVFVIGMVTIRNIKNRDWYDLGLSSRNEVLEPIVKSGQFYQTFISPKNNLKGINLFLSTYYIKITSPYKLVLFDETCNKIIIESKIEVAKIDDNKYSEVIFNEISDSKDKKYCFTVEPVDEKVNTPITLNFSKYGSYIYGELTINNIKVQNEDVVFQLIYPVK